MVDPLSPTAAAAPIEVERSRWRYLLPVVWAALGAWIVVALAHGASLRDDFLSLALVSFFMTTALLGSRVWLWIHDRWERLTSGRSSVHQRRQFSAGWEAGS
jgi:hypothetical protein